MVFALLFVAAVAFTTTLLSRSIFNRGTEATPRRESTASSPVRTLITAYLLMGSLAGAAAIAVLVWNEAHSAHGYDGKYVDGAYVYDYTNWTSLVATLLLSSTIGILLATAGRAAGRWMRRPRRGAMVSG